MEEDSTAGNYAGRQRKMVHDKSLRLFPLVNKQLPSIMKESRQGRICSSLNSAASSLKSSRSSASSYGSSCFHCRHCCHHYSPSHLSRHSHHHHHHHHHSPSPLSRYRHISSQCCSRCDAAPLHQCHTPFSSCSSPRRSSCCSCIECTKSRRCGLRRSTSAIPEGLPPSSSLPGRHYLDWYIPRGIVGSRVTRNPPSRPATCKGLSPLHRKEKHEWLRKTIEPRKSSLPLSPPYKPFVRDYPCHHADNLQQAFKDYYMQKDPTLYYKLITSTPNSSTRKKPAPSRDQILPSHDKILPNFLQNKTSLSGPSDKVPSTLIADTFSSRQQDPKTLPLQHDKHFRQQKMESTPGTMFSQPMGGGQWYVIHPDFRREPGMRGVWPTEQK